MRIENLRSPKEKTGGIVYFGRMLDKIRLHQSGKLPNEYHKNLGGGFDDTCVKFLWIEYPALVERVAEGGSDEEILEWCFARGRRPSEDEIHIWNEFLRKRGWNDSGTETLVRRKKESGFENREEIQTFFNYIDADEGREP